MTIAVRSFHDNDIPRLIEVWNSAYAPYGGWVPRSEEHWRWSILARPNVSAGAVQVATLDGRVAGFAVPSGDGVVLEFAVDGELADRERQRVAAALLEHLERELQARGVETLELDVPDDDRLLRRVFASRDYRAEQAETLQLVIVSPSALVRALLESRESALRPLGSASVLLGLTPGRYRFHPEPWILVNFDAGLVTVRPLSAAEPADLTIRTDLSTLAEIVLGRTPAATAVGDGRAVIEPAARAADGATVLRLLAPQEPWFVPRADAR